MAFGAADLSIKPPRQDVEMRVSLSGGVFVLAALFLWSLVLQAPLRFGLGYLYLDVFIYLPKLLMLAAVVLLPWLRFRASAPALVISGLAALYLLWGAVNLSSPVQAAFGLWVLVPLLFGLWAGAVTQIAQWRRLFCLLFVTAATGVLLDPFLDYPWSGQALELLGKSIEMSRQWTAFGLERYAGFARASFNAASQLLIFGVMLVVLIHRRLAKLLVWLVAGAGIAMTTSKGPLGAWLLLSLYFAGGVLSRWPRYWMQLWLVVLTIALLAMILLPLSTLWIRYDPSFQGHASKFLFASFGDRLTWMWPDSLRLLDLNGSWHWWVGRGLGGIGGAQQYFESERYLAADNLFVYVAVYVGLPMSLLLFIAMWWRIVRLILSRDMEAWRLPVLLALIVYGAVVNEVEEGLLALFLGLALSARDMKTKGRP